MTLHLLRVAALMEVAVWAVWEIASQPPLLLLLVAVLAAWGLLIEFLVTLPRQAQSRDASTDKEVLRRKRRLDRAIFWGGLIIGVSALIWGDTADKVFGAGLVIVPTVLIGWAVYTVLRDRRSARKGA